MSEDLRADAVEYLRHSLATLAYRGGKVVRGAPADFGSFKVGNTSRAPSEVLAHIGDLLEWALSLARGEEMWRDSSPGPWENEVQRFFGALAALDAHLSRPGSLRCPWQRLFQGPIADALTHVGQLAMLRRLAGSAVRGENYFKADIATGQVGPDQATPRREFK